MKRKITWIVLSSMIALLLCSCQGGTVSAPTAGSQKDNTVLQQESSEDTAASTASAESSEIESTPEASESSGTPSADTSAEKETTESKSESSSAEASTGASSEMAEESDEVSDIVIELSEDEDEPDEGEDSEEEQIVPRHYIDPLKITVDISDQAVRSVGTDLSKPAVYYIKSAEELHKFYESYRKTYSLDSTDGGLDFNTSVQTLDSGFFADNDMIIIVQRYAKGTEFEVGDVYSQDGGAAIDIYKEEPSSDDNAFFVLDMIAAESKELGGKTPVLNILPPGGYITDEGEDDDEIVPIDE